MPYAIKGMDLSFSGILSYCEDLVMMDQKLSKSFEESCSKGGKGVSKRILKKWDVKNKSVKQSDYSREDLCYSL